MNDPNEGLGHLIDEFCDRWNHTGAKAYIAPWGTEGLFQSLRDVWDDLNLGPSGTVVYWLDDNLEGLPWDNYWTRIAPMMPRRWDAASGLSCAREAAVGLTGCTFAVAETGSIALTAGPGRGLLPSVLPHTHIVLVDAARIVPTVRDGLRLLRNDGIPPMAKLITGPSMTADIEGTLVVGVHGPAQVAAVVYQID